jgi:hypothetical protein
MRLKISLNFCLILIFISCEKKEEVLKYSVCNDIIGTMCDGSGIGEYCTFGFKWGDNNPFANAGLEKPGPSSGEIIITYKFQEPGYVFDTHAERHIISQSFDNVISCSKQEIKEAFSEWESVAAISFVEDTIGNDPDIRIMIANIRQGGLGYPPFPDEPCNELSGMLVISPESQFTCDIFYNLVLHEIGHILGLGHVRSNNVMNPDKYYLNLQSGDITGIRSIYGEK